MGSSELVELVAWRIIANIAIPGIHYRKCHFRKWFGIIEDLYRWITWKVASIYNILQLILFTNMAPFLGIWAKASDLNLFLHWFLRIFCFIKSLWSVELALCQAFFSIQPNLNSAMPIADFEFEHFFSLKNHVNVCNPNSLPFFHVSNDAHFLLRG